MPSFDLDVTTSGFVGAGTTTPTVPLHVVGAPTLGAALIAPREPVSGGNSELVLAEDDDGSYGMKFRYEAVTNELRLIGRADDIDVASPHLVVERDSGDVSIGTVARPGKLTVDGSDDPGRPAISVLGGTGTGLNVSSTSTTEDVLVAEAIGGGNAAVRGTGALYGLAGETNSSAVPGAGVYGASTPNSGTTYGVFGEAESPTGHGVFGQCNATTGIGFGVAGSSSSTTGRGVSGTALAVSGLNYGVRGFSASAAGWGVFAAGNLGATGTKSFVNPHPSDPSKEIRFVCLEGNESGTYFRGSSRLLGGIATIEVPEDFRMASEDEQLTVQVTARGRARLLWVESRDLSRIVVRGEPDVEFDYFVNGVRRGFLETRTEHPNGSFVPTVRGVPFGSQYPPAIRELLVRNGILNPDFTPNETTAAQMGWKLRAEPSAAVSPR